MSANASSRPLEPRNRRERRHHREMLDVPATAAYLGVTERMIRRLIAERRIPFHHVGKFIRFDLEDLDDFVDQGRVEASR